MSGSRLLLHFFLDQSAVCRKGACRYAEIELPLAASSSKQFGGAGAAGKGKIGGLIVVHAAYFVVTVPARQG